MDSFYDAPRRAPAPTPIEKFAVTPVVPEVSLISSKPHFNDPNSYNSWRCAAARPLTSNRDNILNGHENSLLRKQVRFDSPQDQPFRILHDKINNGISKPVATKQSPVETNKRTFEDIYMANIPNRHLDLSIVDLNRVAVAPPVVEQDKLSPVTTTPSVINDSKENELPKTYREFLRTQQKVSKANESVTDIFNYKNDKRFDVPKMDPPMPSGTDYRYYTDPKYPSSQQLDLVKHRSHDDDLNLKETKYCCRTPSESEPTNRDLLKIIAQQNEQLLILQKQVAMLLNQTHQAAAIESAPAPAPAREINTDPMVNNGKLGGMSKFSMNLMTSFEVAIRPQHQQQLNRQNFNYEPKIQEVTEIESMLPDDKMQSLHLQVPENCPSPEPSININMNDYDSSDDEVSASEIGTTFYRNLMGQVNNILHKAQIQTREDLMARNNSRAVPNNPSKTMLRVKEATLKHLKSIGVSVDALDEECVSCENDSKDYSPTEVSFTVKQLLMKYLPDDHLAKVTPNKKPVVQGMENEGIMATRPEFSFASLQYMKKYNLIPPEQMSKPQKKDLAPGLSNGNNNKILDLTALKMQPKLL